MQNQQQFINLANKVQMPQVGFGTYLVPDEQAQALVFQALGLGYRLVDTAEGYGNESGVGAGIKQAMAGLGISRDEVFVTTKLWPGNKAWGMPVKSHQQTIESLEASLDRLGLDYVDLYLIHAPFGAGKRLEQWQALVELQSRGLARAIGVSNYTRAHLEEIKAAGLPLPQANQIELHPWSQKPDLVSYLGENDIAIIAYSSLAPLSTWRTAEGQASAKTEEMRAEGADSASPFKAMARKYGVSEAQVLLRWGVQKGFGVLPKSVSQERMKQNLDLFGFELDAGDMVAIAEMDRGEAVAWHTGDPSEAA